jgi:hypothetical protein
MMYRKKRFEKRLKDIKHNDRIQRPASEVEVNQNTEGIGCADEV